MYTRLLALQGPWVGEYVGVLTHVLRLDATGPASTHYSALTAALCLVPLLLPESDPTN